MLLPAGIAGRTAPAPTSAVEGATVESGGRRMRAASALLLLVLLGLAAVGTDGFAARCASHAGKVRGIREPSARRGRRLGSLRSSPGDSEEGAVGPEGAAGAEGDAWGPAAEEERRAPAIPEAPLKEEKDLFVPIFVVVATTGFSLVYAYETVRLWLEK